MRPISASDNAKGLAAAQLAFSAASEAVSLFLGLAILIMWQIMESMSPG
jgi:hypothetical protein